MTSILILGGYGNFGKRIAQALTNKGLAVIIAGRSLDKASAFSATLPVGLAYPAAIDISLDICPALRQLAPSVVINTCGPFQNSDYSVANACIACGVHYIDLADGRDFVTGITSLDPAAKTAGVAIISGASTVPGLSSAVIEHFKDEFSAIDDVTFGISPGQKAERGLATTKAIMSYVGKPLKSFAGHSNAYGWQDIYRQLYPGLGKRWMANCDVPDLDLLPAAYDIKSIHFSAGLQLSLLHLGTWLLSWLVRLGLPLNLPRHAELLWKTANCFDRFGSADGGMHIIITGHDHKSQPLTKKWFIIAKDGDGPQIPCVPAIVLAEKLARGQKIAAGTYPCVGMVSLIEYLHELERFKINQYML